MDRARMVAVVVPSPATSLVFCATALTSLAPMFSKGSGKSISLLTVTPSLVTVGPPKLLSRITLRPVGPSVMPTACASFSAPLKSFFRASSVYRSCFAIIQFYPLSGLIHYFGQDIRFPKNLHVFAIHLDIGTGIPSVENLITLGNGQFAALTIFQKFPRAHSQNPSPLRLLFRRVGKKDTAGSLLFCFQWFHNNSIIQGSNFEIDFLCHGLIPILNKRS